jgi:hypothetical protein
MDATELAAVTRRFRKAEAALEAARAELRAACLEAMAGGMPQAEVVRVTGWTRETLRKLKPAGE